MMQEEWSRLEHELQGTGLQTIRVDVQSCGSKPANEHTPVEKNALRSSESRVPHVMLIHSKDDANSQVTVYESSTRTAIDMMTFAVKTLLGKL